MLHSLPIPNEIVAIIQQDLPETWKYRFSVMTAEEQFYCRELLKFSSHTVTPKNSHYLELKARLIRFLKGQAYELFTERDWEMLSYLWQTRFLNLCLSWAETQTTNRS